MKKTEIKKRAQELMESFNACTTKKCEFGGFHTSPDGTEYMLIKTSFEILFHGFVERFEEASTLKFFGVSSCGNNLHLLFSRGDGLSINNK